MAEFYAAVTTDAGLALSADLLTGEQIVFTKLVAGSGIYDEQEMTRPMLQKVCQIREPRQQFEFSRIEKVTDNCILLKTLMSNVSLTEGYRMTEIGIYAKKQGEEGDGILYSISVAKEPDFFPCYNGLAAVEIIEEYYITVSDAAYVSLQTSSSAAVLKEDLEKLKVEIQAELNQKIEDLKKQIGDLSELLTENKGCLVDAINEIAVVIRPLVEYGWATDQDIDDIINEIYVDDPDWVAVIDIAADSVIEEIINGTYVDEYEEENEDVISDEDIDAIIAGTYVDETEEESADSINKEIDDIISNSFNGKEG
jgi:prefoldin subunit 5